MTSAVASHSCTVELYIELYRSESLLVATNNGGEEKSYNNAVCEWAVIINQTNDRTYTKRDTISYNC